MKTLSKLGATALLLSSVFAAPSAVANEWGCTCLLCLANPGGPTEFAECVAPIQKMWRALEKGEPFPTCDMEDGNDGSAYARPVIDAYDPCPDGTRPVSQWSVVAEGQKTGNTLVTGWYQSEAINYTFSQPPATSQPRNLTCGSSYGCPPDPGADLGPRACVGNATGGYYEGASPYSRGTYVGVFDKVVWQEAKSRTAIDVYIDNKLFTRVHY